MNLDEYENKGSRSLSCCMKQKEDCWVGTLVIYHLLLLAAFPFLGILVFIY